MDHDEAVSPVIGTILMVAISVVLAAVIFVVVFVLVSNLGKGSEKAPSISFTKDETADRISVISADPGLEAQHFSIKASVAGDCQYNAAVDGTEAMTTAYVAFETACSVADSTADADALATNEPVNGGDSLAFCSSGSLTDVTVSIRHEDSNTLVYETTFTTLGDCP